MNSMMIRLAVLVSGPLVKGIESGDGWGNDDALNLAIQAMSFPRAAESLLLDVAQHLENKLLDRRTDSLSISTDPI